MGRFLCGGELGVCLLCMVRGFGAFVNLWENR